MGLRDSDGRVSCILSDWQNYPDKREPSCSIQRRTRGRLRGAAGLGPLLSLNCGVAQGKAFGPQSPAHRAQNTSQLLSEGAARQDPRGFLPCQVGLGGPQQKPGVMVRGDRIKHLAVSTQQMPPMRLFLTPWEHTTQNSAWSHDHLYMGF